MTNCKKSLGFRSSMNIAFEICQYLIININQYTNICRFIKSLLKLI